MKAQYFLYIFLFFFSCGRFGAMEEPSTNGRRIVCISKQYAEIIFALGASDELVAVDLSSTYPPEVKKLPTIGYHRALSVEAILAEKPDLILHDNNIGPPHVVEQLNSLNIPMKVFDTKATDIESTKMLIREMGDYFDRKDQANELCDQLDKDMYDLLQLSPKVEEPSVLIVHYGRASNVYLTITDKSNAAKFVEWAGGKMAVTGERGMKQLSAEVVAAADPDILLLTDFGYDRLGDHDKVLELPGLAQTKAARNGRVYRVEEHDMVYFGPRTGQTISDLHKIFFNDQD